MKNDTEFSKTHNTSSAADSGGSFLEHIWASIGTTIVLAIICCGIYPLIVFGLAQTLFSVKANGSLIKKDGSFTSKPEEAIGSSLIGQNFSPAGYFHPRPSAAGNGYDPTSSGGTNLGPLSAKLINGTTKATTQPATQPSAPPVAGPDAVDFDGIRDRIVHYCVDNNIAYEPADALKPFMDAQGNLDDVKLIKAFNADTPLAFTPKELIPGDAVTASGSGLDPHISPENAKFQKNRVAAARNISPELVQQLIDENTDGRSLGVFGDPGVNVLRLNIALDTKYPLPPPPAAPTTAPTTAPAAGH